MTWLVVPVAKSSRGWGCPAAHSFSICLYANEQECIAAVIEQRCAFASAVRDLVSSFGVRGESGVETWLRCVECEGSAAVACHAPVRHATFLIAQINKWIRSIHIVFSSLCRGQYLLHLSVLLTANR